jgi:hypothetical protein
VAAVIGSKKPAPTECISCGEKQRIERHCPKSKNCNWTRCLNCQAITAIVAGKLKAIAGRF